MDTENNTELTFDNMASLAAEDTSANVPVESIATEVEGAESLAAEGAESAVVPQYQANYKFKVKDKELEFDEDFRAIVTDESREKKIREWHEKYHGFDEIKASRDNVKTELETYRGQITPILTRLQAADHHLQRNDIEGFFKELEIPETAVQEYFERKAAVARLSPEAQLEYTRQQNESREAAYYRKQYEALQTQTNQDRVSQIRNQKSMEMDNAINDPAVSGVAQAYDAQFGAGAFKEELRQRGVMAWNQTKQDPPAKQIAEQMAKLYSHLASPPAQQVTQTQDVAAQAPLKKSVPVIPAAQSTGKTPVKKSFVSFDEMEKAYKDGNY